MPSKNSRTAILILTIPWLMVVESLIASPDSVVVFNEIQYHPADRAEGEQREWIELYNQMGIMTDVSGWRIAGGASYTIPKGTIMPAGGYLVISSKVEGEDLGPIEGNLSNTGEQLQLLNQSGRLMDEISYDDSGDWPVAADGSGATLAKLDPDSASGPAQNWRWSAQIGGTPGTTNFPGDNEIELTIAEVLTPEAIWRYSEASVDFGEDWATVAHVAGNDWKEGGGVFAFEPTLQDPIGTALTFPGLNDPYATTYYFETEIHFDADTASRVDHLLLSHLVDDGLVVYVNGNEVHRYNMPAGAVTFDTLAIDNTEAIWIDDIRIPSTDLVAGSNRISVELHQARAGSSDVVFGARLKVALRPPAVASTGIAVGINEVSAAGPGFWIELRNDGTTAADAGDLVLSISGDPNREVIVAAGTMIAPEGYLLLASESFPWPVDANDRVFLFDSSRQVVVDARAVSNRLRGRDETPGSVLKDAWLYPTSPTPGAPNEFSRSNAIVFNEVFYNGPAQVAVPGVPPTLAPTTEFGFDHVWRYDSSGLDPGDGWAGTAHPGWPSGPGLLGYDNRDFDHPINTEFPPPNSINPFVITHYFETDWSVSAADLAAIESLELWFYVDDGAIFFVNGIEVGRFAMPDGAANSSTLASSGGEAELTGPIVVPANLLIEGSNRVSAEVHQSSSGSSDIVFGLEAITQRVVDVGVPPVPFQKSDEQWIELYNRSDAPVDLTGWSISGGISFEFPAGAVLAPGAFAVAANDRTLFSKFHPGIEIIGEFSGAISRSGDMLELTDTNGNPVDTVTFYDGGRWPGAADGGGSSLERRDPDADSSTAESWAASDTSNASGWRTYSYRGVAAPSAVGSDNQWREFVIGLLFAGEMLLDDISVIEEPDSAQAQLITNTDFTNGDSDWRMLGNHRHSEVIDDPDPDAPGNKVLRLIATGPTGHMHDHLETTLASRVTNGREYQITFRAKWISGCNQINTRLYFNRLPMTNVIDRPLTGGTPGVVNSMAELNIGPAFIHVTHEPAVPEPGQLTTIHAMVTDPDGVSSLTVHYSVNDAVYQQATMVPSGNAGDYQVSLPGQSEAAIVHFFITAEDAGGGVSQFPAMGIEGGAAYKVNDGNAAPTALQNFRIVIRNELRDWMHTDINVMSNDRIPATVIVDEERIYYDVGLRLKGSERARNQNPRVGFNVRFNADDKFRGIHETVSIDRSEGVGTGQLEMLFDVMIANSSGNLSRYYDLIQIISPEDRHVGGAVLQLARYEDTLLDSQFGDGSQGTRYEYELIYYPTTANANGYKRPEPDGVVGTAVRDLGEDKERYRWNFLIKDDREEDPFDPIIAYCKHFSKRGADFEAGLEQVVDVDNWLRGMAYAVASGAGDNAGAGSQHNGMYYARPDGRVMFLPHDMDFAFDASRTITANPEAAKIVAIPKYARIYYGHLQDIVETTYNRTYMQQWTDHFDELLPRQPWSSHLNYINSRSNNLLSQIRSRAREVDFAATSESGQSTDSSSVTLKGTGWVNIRKIRLAGTDGELPVEWVDETDWEVRLPVSPGNNSYVLEAVDFSGNIVGTVDWTAIGTGTLLSPATTANLRISEIHYHPADLSASEIEIGMSDPDAFEFIELWNFSAATIDLSGVRFSNGITYAFEADTQLAADQRFLLVRDAEAFGVRYPGIRVDGTFSGTGLSNSGERITLQDGLGREITSFQYNDKAPWSVDADGEGYSLVFGSGDANAPASWLPSAGIGGTPGTTDAIPFAQWSELNGVVSAESDDDNDGNPAIIEYLAGSLPASPDQVLAARSNLQLTYPISLNSEGISLRLQASSNLTDWQEVSEQAEFLGYTHNQDHATATATWSVLAPGQFFRLAAATD